MALRLFIVFMKAKLKEGVFIKLDKGMTKDDCPGNPSFALQYKINPGAKAQTHCLLYQLDIRKLMKDENFETRIETN